MDYKKIVVKEIGKRPNIISKGNTITEYMVYMIDHGQKIEGYIEVGEKAKNLRVNELIVTNFITNDYDGHKIIISDIVEEISFKDIYNVNLI